MSCSNNIIIFIDNCIMIKNNVCLYFNLQTTKPIDKNIKSILSHITTYYIVDHTFINTTQKTIKESLGNIEGVFKKYDDVVHTKNDIITNVLQVFPKTTHIVQLYQGEDFVGEFPTNIRCNYDINVTNNNTFYWKKTFILSCKPTTKCKLLKNCHISQRQFYINIYYYLPDNIHLFYLLLAHYYYKIRYYQDAIHFLTLICNDTNANKELLFCSEYLLLLLINNNLSSFIKLHEKYPDKLEPIYHIIKYYNSQKEFTKSLEYISRINITYDSMLPTQIDIYNTQIYHECFITLAHNKKIMVIDVGCMNNSHCYDGLYNFIAMYEKYYDVILFGTNLSLVADKNIVCVDTILAQSLNSVVIDILVVYDHVHINLVANKIYSYMSSNKYYLVNHDIICNDYLVIGQFLGNVTKIISENKSGVMGIPKSMFVSPLDIKLFFMNKIEQKIDVIQQGPSFVVSYKLPMFVQKNLELNDNDWKIKYIMRKPKTSVTNITFTITTCKRLKLFRETMHSLLTNCVDIEIIDTWICIDDNSSEEDREQMRMEFPFFTFIFKTPDQKGHARSMNMLWDVIKTDYILHYEDDWVTSTQFSLMPFLKYVKSGNCNHLVLKKIALGNDLVIDHVNNFAIHDYVYDREASCKPVVNTLYDKLIMHDCESVKNGWWWPGFTLNPSIINVGLLKKVVGNFNENIQHDMFEYDYAIRCYDRNYKVLFVPLHIDHSGYLSSYKLNDTKRYYD